MDLNKLDELIDKYQGKQGVLIQLLLDVQAEFNWIPKEAITRINQRLGIPISQIYRVASFYQAMSLVPNGKHLVSVCTGTACHVRGGPKVLEKAEDTLGIKVGETTGDLQYTIKKINCLGCCALGPVMMVDEDYHGKIAPAKVKEIIESYD
ncbi:NADH-quinone oxidoreductase subunit NuoE [Chloroflexota bacterium]